jgi:hypothetical protein
VIELAHENGIVIRAIGGVAVALHTESELPVLLRRRYQDIDVVTTKRHSAEAMRLLTDLGYQAHERFNALNSAHRMLAYDLVHGRQVDVFVGEFRMCHRIPIASRLHIERLTAPLAELLLTKLQVVQVSAKDVTDILTLLLMHEVGDGDVETINTAFIASVLGGDWGFWRTVRGTSETVSRELANWGLKTEQRDLIEDRLARLWARIEDAPKTLGWRARSRIGDRIRWYELPEEIDHRGLIQGAPESTHGTGLLSVQKGDT